VLGVAQDTALRDKRRALGRALAAGITGSDAEINYERLFIRAVSDIDEPHIQVLDVLATKRARAGELSGSSFQAGWPTRAIAARAPELSGALPALLPTLEAHGLVRAEPLAHLWQASRQSFNITPRGRLLLQRLAENDPESG
jgi:hypothetical protein